MTFKKELQDESHTSEAYVPSVMALGLVDIELFVLSTLFLSVISV